MKDNNKRNLLIIVALATLIIGIIGGTFAFFSASGGSANDAITANATTLANLGFTSSNSKIAYNLVPVASENPYFYRYPGIAASGSHSCLDDVGNQICSIYEFTITNTASVAQTIYVSFVPSENTFDNMYFAAFNTTIASADYVVATGSNGSGSNFVLTPQTTSGNSTLGHQATKLTKNSTSPIDMPGLSTTLNAGTSITYTVLVWLQETKNEQNTEQGGRFKAGINVTTGGNSTGVTGVMEGSSYTAYNGMVQEARIGWENVDSNFDSFTTATYALNNIMATYDWWTRPVVFKNVVGNFSGYCINKKVDGIENCEYYCLSSGVSQSLCESFSSYLESTYYGLEHITYDCELTNKSNVITESYIAFEPSINTNMAIGAFEIKGGDGGAAYSTNRQILNAAFGYEPEQQVHESDSIDPFSNYYTEYYGYYCVLSEGECENDYSLSVSIYDDGRVELLTQDEMYEITQYGEFRNFSWN